MIYSDLTLAQKLERTEARANADFVETRKRLFPASDATWKEVAGAYAMFDGVGSPLTQTFGLGVFETATSEHLDEIEEFYRERGSDVFHEVSPMIDPSHMSLLCDRGYRPIELTSVMFRDLESEHGVEPSADNSNVASSRPIHLHETRIWTETIAAGWATVDESLRDFMLAFGGIATKTTGGHPFIAELKAQPIAAGGLQIYDDVCILAGAATIPAARRQGAQIELLKGRLQYAVELGCRFAMMCAAPGSQSQKNAQKNGFAIAYTRTKWHLKL